MGSIQFDTADKSQSSRHILCAVHLESWQKLAYGKAERACTFCRLYPFYLIVYRRNARTGGGFLAHVG